MHDCLYTGDYRGAGKHMWRWNGKASWRDRVTTMACRLQQAHTGRACTSNVILCPSSKPASLAASGGQASNLPMSSKQQSKVRLRPQGVPWHAADSTPAPIFLNSEPKLSPVHCSVIMLLLCPCCVCPMTVPSAIRGCSASSRQGQVTMPVPRCHGNNLLFFGVCCVLKKLSYRHRDSNRFSFSL